MLISKTLTLLTLALAATFTLPAEDRMSAGFWELTTTTEGRPPSTSRSCFTAAMVELGNRPAATLREDTEKAVAKRGMCTLKAFNMEGKTISMTQTCGPRTVSMKTTYGTSTFETTSTTTGAGPTRESRIVGRLLGPCK